MTDRRRNRYAVRCDWGRAALLGSLATVLALSTLASLAQAQTSVDLTALDAYYSTLTHR